MRLAVTCGNSSRRYCLHSLANRNLQTPWVFTQSRSISVQYVPFTQPARTKLSVKNQKGKKSQQWSVREQHYPGGIYSFLQVEASKKSYFPKSPFEGDQRDLRAPQGAILGYDRNTNTHQIRQPPWIGQYADTFVPLSGRWLRDHCTCAECVNPDTGQRKTNVLNGDVECRVTAVEETGERERLRVIFADGHVSNISSTAVSNRHSIKRTSNQFGLVPLKRWDAEIEKTPPSVPYSKMKGKDVGLARALRLLKTYGFCFIDSMPPTPEASEELLRRIGPIRNTHYGGFYDFTSDLSLKDTAYTAEALEPHTDTTYFTDPVGLQALHLLSHTAGEGGLSSLVDGFHCAERLFQEDAAAYKILSETGVSGHASGNEGISIQPADSFPTLVHSKRGHLMQVRWNNADRAGIDMPLPDIDSWYEAAEKWHKLITKPSNQYWFQLEPGKMLLFDNWRALHGRSAFTGKRRMCGGYINHDDWISKMKNLNLEPEQLRASTVRG